MPPQFDALEPSPAAPGPERAAVVVVGGGWSGLAAAVELARHGVAVTLLESARQLGGRARCARFGRHRVDNGQHLLLGANRAVLALLRVVGVDATRVLLRRPLELRVRRGQADEFLLRTPSLPAPLHLLVGLAQARGISVRTKLRAIRMLQRLRKGEFRLAQDVSVAALLDQHGQPPALRAMLWDPLCVAALNTDPAEASARVFLRVLQESFHAPRSNSDLLIPRCDLGTLLPAPAVDFVEGHGGKVILGERVKGITIKGGAIAGVELAGRSLAAQHLILAVPPVACRRLLNSHAALRPTAGQLARLDSEPICTVYLEYPPETRLPTPMLGLTGGIAQWVFDRSIGGLPGVLAVVISARGPHMRMSNAALVQAVDEELARCLPQLGELRNSLVIREKRATFSCRVDVEGLRPGPDTPVRGCWLAGDYTATGLPATLEGAVRSGTDAARAVLRSLPMANAVSHAPRAAQKPAGVTAVE
jgi:hydroxysqualene dehydroxylase